MSDTRPSFGGNTANQRKQLAAIWKRKDRNGNEYFTMSIDIDGKSVNLIAFQNQSKKEGSKQPDFIAYGD